MSLGTRRCDPISDLKPGRYDYKVKIRVIRKLRGATLTGEVFKAFNIIIVDNMVRRIRK